MRLVLDQGGQHILEGAMSSLDLIALGIVGRRLCVLDAQSLSDFRKEIPCELCTAIGVELFT